jgi:hypothetical protein
MLSILHELELGPSQCMKREYFSPLVTAKEAALGKVKFLNRRVSHLDFYIAPHNLRGENLKFMKS